MKYRAMWLLVPLSLAFGCGTNLTKPVVAHTETNSGYEAALVTAKARGDRVVAQDRIGRYLRVAAKPASREEHQTYFDILAMPGRVSIFIDPRPGQRLGRTEIGQLRRRMAEVACSIDERSRGFAGDASGSADCDTRRLTRALLPPRLIPLP